MVEEWESPSAGWQDVYREMGVDDEGVEENDPSRCPDCGLVVADEKEHRCPLKEFEQSDEDVELLPPPGEATDD